MSVHRSVMPIDWLDAPALEERLERDFSYCVFDARVSSAASHGRPVEGVPGFPRAIYFGASVVRS
jgi:hypothetical protein